MKRIVFITGTRADFGKIKPLIAALKEEQVYDIHIFVTGMHLLEKYGSTVHEVFKTFPKNVYMYNNQAFAPKMEIVLSNTVYGFSNYVNEIKPDLIIVHGDRVEALASAIVGSFNNIRVAHIEGGELSGTIDELIRHSVSKLAHIHFVANEEAKKRVIQMGENEENIYTIGSPDIDVLCSSNLPTLDEVLNKYNIRFKDYAILIYHPVTTEVERLPENVKEVVDAVIESGLNYIVIYPNNDLGSEIIFKEYEKLEGNNRFRIFPSIRFEKFLVLLKNSRFIIGNSSCGIREAPVYSVPTLNIGNRQHNRFHHESIFNVEGKKEEILRNVNNIIARNCKFPSSSFFGNGKSRAAFVEILRQEKFWNTNPQKQFIDF